MDKKYILTGIIGLFWVAALLLHLGAGLYFPQPFGDEAYFFYASKAFAENLNFFAPELHSGRTLYWMPFGYPALAGLAMKLLSSDFVLLRHLAFAGVSLAYFALCLAFWEEKDAGWKILLTGLFLLSKPWLVCGNLARMEAFVLAFMTLSLCLYRLGFRRLSLSVLFFSGIFHPIGLACVPLWLFFRIGSRNQIQLSEFLIPTLASLPLVLLFYLGLPPDFSHIRADWQFQMAGKSVSEILLLLLRFQSAGFFLLAGFLAFQFIRLNNWQSLQLVCLGLWLFLIRIYGRGDTYGIYTSLGMLFMALALWDYLLWLTARPGSIRIEKWMLFFGMVMLLLLSKTIHLPLAGPFPSLSYGDIRKNQSYLRPEEITSIRQKVDSVCRLKNWKTLAIYPEAVGCILYRKGLSFTHIMHNFEDSRPDGLLYFSAEGDSFEADRNLIYAAYKINPETRINLRNGNWSLFTNTGRAVVSNRNDALNRCRRAGIECPE